MRVERRGWVIRSGLWVNLQREEPLGKDKVVLVTGGGMTRAV